VSGDPCNVCADPVDCAARGCYVDAMMNLQQEVEAGHMAKPMNEGDFMESVISAALALGWQVYHTHDSRRSRDGFPDLVMIRGESMLVFELKGDRKGAVPTPAQLGWIAAFKGVRYIEADVKYPRDRAEIDDLLAKARR